MVNRLGDVKVNFIHPISTKDIHIFPGDGGTTTTRVFQVKGTVESWIKNVFNLVKDHPKAVFPYFDGCLICRLIKLLTLTFLQIEVAKRCTKLFEYVHL